MIEGGKRTLCTAKLVTGLKLFGKGATFKSSRVILLLCLIN